MGNKSINSKNNIKLLDDTDENKNKKTVAIIISFKSGQTYDPLFTKVQQKSQQGTKVLVYQCSSHYIVNFIKMFEGEASSEYDKQLYKNIKQLHPDCVVFNWQCCSGYSSETFQQGSKNIYKFLKIILDKGHMAMFSDFSLKALIKNWQINNLGPNPFKKIGGHQGLTQLSFDNKQLLQCPSAQLQIVGEMAQKGTCNIQTLASTILYGVDQTKTDIYELKVLTIVTSIKSNSEYRCKIGNKQGLAGHVLLKYKSGGNLLVSMGHWIQLMKIDTSQQKLFEFAENQYGNQQVIKMKQQYALLDNAQKKSYISKQANLFVQNSAPCQNMNRKAKKAMF